MPINYKNGKIYEIVCRITGEKYVGSTTQPLSKRLTEHRNLKNTMSKQIIERGDYYINLLEECPCDNREQLLQRERHYYDSIEGGCINKVRPWVSKEEAKERNREYLNVYNEENKERIDAYYKAYRAENKERINAYYEANKEQIKASGKAYSEKNRGQILANKRTYYERNKERIKENMKAYREKNKEKILAYDKARYERKKNRIKHKN
jgi:hypothetical protein